MLRRELSGAGAWREGAELRGRRDPQGHGTEGVLSPPRRSCDRLARRRFMRCLHTHAAIVARSSPIVARSTAYRAYLCIGSLIRAQVTEIPISVTSRAGSRQGILLCVG